MKDYPVIYQGNLFRMKTDLDYILFVRWRTEYPNALVEIYDDLKICYTNSIYTRRSQ
jgi:hypothetical protein